MAKFKGFEIKAAKAADAGEIYFYEEIGENWDGSGTTAKSFQKELKALGKVSQLDIYINSPGGSVFDGVAIHNQLARHPANKIVHVDGIAASIASVIAMVGDEIEMASNGLMMIHDPWGLAFGNAIDFRKIADELDKVGGTLVNTYVNRTGGKADHIAQLMHDETWMDAEEAVAAGFADRVSKGVDMANMARYDFSRFRNTPDFLINPNPAKDAPAAVAPERLANIREAAERAKQLIAKRS